MEATFKYWEKTRYFSTNTSRILSKILMWNQKGYVCKMTRVMSFCAQLIIFTHFRFKRSHQNSSLLQSLCGPDPSQPRPERVQPNAHPVHFVKLLFSGIFGSPPPILLHLWNPPEALSTPSTPTSFRSGHWLNFLQFLFGKKIIDLHRGQTPHQGGLFSFVSPIGPLKGFLRWHCAL